MRDNKGKFAKGNPGRAAGSQNKKTLARKDELEAMFNERLGFAKLFDTIDAIEEPKDKAAAILKVMEFFMAKHKSVDVQGETIATVANVVFTSTGVTPIQSESDIDDSK